MADSLGWSCLAGTPVPRLGQGTWYLGEGRSPRKQELAALRTGIEAGMTLIDTAEMYGEGRSEKLVGEAIAPYDREKLFLVSKVYPWNAGEDQIFRACENTLRRLKTDYLDMYLPTGAALFHWKKRRSAWRIWCAGDSSASGVCPIWIKRIWRSFGRAVPDRTAAQTNACTIWALAV